MSPPAQPARALMQSSRPNRVMSGSAGHVGPWQMLDDVGTCWHMMAYYGKSYQIISYCIKSWQILACLHFESCNLPILILRCSQEYVRKRQEERAAATACPAASHQDRPLVLWFGQQWKCLGALQHTISYHFKGIRLNKALPLKEAGL